MNARASDLDQALRAAAGIGNADLPRLPPAVITELAGETVETIAWTYADALKSASASVRKGRRRVALVTAVALAVAGGTTLTVSGVLNVASNTSVNAGDGPQTAARQAAEACIKELEPRGLGFPVPDFKLSDAQLYYQHGRLGFVVLANSKDFGSCSILDGVVESGGGDLVTKYGYPHPAATGISLATNGAWWTMDLSRKRVDVSVVFGLAGSAVTGITIRRADGVVVTASMSNGLWGATWLGTSKAVSITVNSREGRKQWPIDQVPMALLLGSATASASAYASASASASTH